MADSFHLLIKPASSICNLSCTYCFYEDVISRQSIGHRSIMKEDVMDRIIIESLSMANRSVTFGFQGGEPLIAPLEFYERFVERVEALNENDLQVRYTLQTNGMFITERHAHFFKNHGFLIGISIDGNQPLHDLFRIDRKGNGSHDQAIAGMKHLLDAFVDVNVLSVITHQNAPNLLETYDYFKSIGVTHMQFIPVITPKEEHHDAIFGLSDKDYAESHTKLFEAYLSDVKQGKNVRIRYFDNLLAMMRGQRFEQCGLSGKCHSPMVAESNGNIYPCDFYSDDDWLLGNIMESSFQQLTKKEPMRRFIIQGLMIPKKCQSCDVYDLCKGGCRRYRKDAFTPHASELVHCEGIKMFLQSIKARQST